MATVQILSNLMDWRVFCFVAAAGTQAVDVYLIDVCVSCATAAAGMAIWTHGRLARDAGRGVRLAAASCLCRGVPREKGLRQVRIELTTLGLCDFLLTAALCSCRGRARDLRIMRPTLYLEPKWLRYKFCQI